MNKEDVVRRLGEPDAVLSAKQGMTSKAWRCSRCQVVAEFPAPVRPPAPCGCGGVAFEKLARRDH